MSCNKARGALQAVVRNCLCPLPADLLPDNPYDTMNQGCDFLRNHHSPSVDFATIHLWPDSWLKNADDERRFQFARRWINCHVDVCNQLLRKPLVLTEFGWKVDGRAAYFDKVRSSSKTALSVVLKSARAACNLSNGGAHRSLPAADVKLAERHKFLWNR